MTAYFPEPTQSKPLNARYTFAEFIYSSPNVHGCNSSPSDPTRANTERATTSSRRDEGYSPSSILPNSTPREPRAARSKRDSDLLPISKPQRIVGFKPKWIHQRQVNVARAKRSFAAKGRAILNVSAFRGDPSSLSSATTPLPSTSLLQQQQGERSPFSHMTPQILQPINVPTATQLSLCGSQLSSNGSSNGPLFHGSTEVELERHSTTSRGSSMSNLLSFEPRFQDSGEKRIKSALLPQREDFSALNKRVGKTLSGKRPSFQKGRSSGLLPIYEEESRPAKQGGKYASQHKGDKGVLGRMERKGGESMLERQSSFFHAQRVFVPHDKCKVAGPIFPDVKLKSVVRRPSNQSMKKEISKTETRRKKLVKSVSSVEGIKALQKEQGVVHSRVAEVALRAQKLDETQETVAKEFNRQKMERLFKVARKTALSFYDSETHISSPFQLTDTPMERVPPSKKTKEEKEIAKQRYSRLQSQMEFLAQKDVQKWLKLRSKTPSGSPSRSPSHSPSRSPSPVKTGIRSMITLRPTNKMSMEEFAEKLFDSWDGLVAKKLEIGVLKEQLIGLGLTLNHKYLDYLLAPPGRKNAFAQAVRRVSIRGATAWLQKEQFLKLCQESGKVDKIIKMLNEATERANSASPERAASPSSPQPEGRRFAESLYSSIDSGRPFESREAKTENFKLLSRATIGGSPSVAFTSSLMRHDPRFHKAMRVMNKARSLQKELLRKELKKDLIQFHQIACAAGVAPSAAEGLQSSRGIRQFQQYLLEKYEGEEALKLFRKVYGVFQKEGEQSRGFQTSRQVQAFLSKMVSQRERRYQNPFPFPNAMLSTHLNVIGTWWEGLGPKSEDGFAVPIESVKRLFVRKSLVGDMQVTALTTSRECDEVFRVLSILEEGTALKKTMSERQFVQLFSKPLLQSALLNLYALIEDSDLLSADFPLSLRLLRHQRRLFLSSLSTYSKQSAFLNGGNKSFGMDGRAAMDTLASLNSLYSVNNLEEQMYNLENHIYEETHNLFENDKEWQEMTANIPSSGNISAEMTPRKLANPLKERHSLDCTPRPSKSSNSLYKRSFLLSEASHRGTFAVPLEKTTNELSFE